MGRKVGRITGISSFTNQTSSEKRGMFSLDDRQYFGGYWGKISATGGIEIPSVQSGNDYKYHVYISSGTFTVNSGTDSVEYLVIGGGGGGGTGGGGSGGVRVSTPSSPFSASKFQVVGPNVYTVTVGGGGGANSPGTPSYFGPPNPVEGIVATGGGTGLSTGGSGGGGVAAVPGGPINPFAGNIPPFSPPQGNPGNYGPIGYSPVPGGGGGALGEPGGKTDPVTAGVGNNGAAFPEFASPIIYPAIPAPIQPTWILAVGVAGTYGGGGGGGGNRPGPPSGGGFGYPGGAGGGGHGFRVNGPIPPWDNPSPITGGINYTGSGGGGSGGENPGGAPFTTYPGQPGGTGIVIIRYREK